MISVVAGQLTVGNLAKFLAINYCVGSLNNWVKIGQTAYQVVFTAGKVTFIVGQYFFNQMNRQALPPVKPLSEDDFVLVDLDEPSQTKQEPAKLRMTMLQLAELLEGKEPLPQGVEIELIEEENAPH